LKSDVKEWGGFGEGAEPAYPPPKLAAEGTVNAMPKMRLRLGLLPGPSSARWEAYSAPPDPIAVFMGA